MFQQADIDTVESLNRFMAVYADTFLELKGKNGAEEHVESFRKGVEEDLKHIDEKMTALLVKDNANLTLWAVRMSSCGKMMDTLDKNLAFKGKRQWSWEEVSKAMAYLKLVEEGAEATLELNEVSLES